MPHFRRPAAPAAAALALAAGLAALAAAPAPTAPNAARAPARGRQPPAPRDESLSAPASSRVLAQLPDGEQKRRFITDCTGCHQFGTAQAYPGGRARTRDEWDAVVKRMLQYAGATTGFPVISAYRDSAPTADWLARHLVAPPARAALAAPRPLPGGATIVEYRLPQPADLPHDVAVDSAGQVLVTGMFTDAIYALDTATGAFTPTRIPVPRANPRALEIDARGDWWVLLGQPRQVARHTPASGEWKTFDIGEYPHSVALGADGKVWYNGHFTKDPELVGYHDPVGGEARRFSAPPHPTLAKSAGGPVPYELRVSPRGPVWLSELQGNRVLSLDPATGRFRAYDMPVTFSAPRRFDVDREGALWIPAYAANALVRLDPGSGRFEQFALPTKDAVPYVARVDHRTGAVWVGASASDEVYAFDPRRRRFTTYPLPSRGAMIRHMVMDPRNGDVWLAYGASPGIPARIARLRPGR